METVETPLDPSLKGSATPDYYERFLLLFRGNMGDGLLEYTSPPTAT